MLVILRERFDRYGVAGGERLHLDQSTALEHVRDLRDTFVDLILANTTDEMDAEHLIEGYAEIVDARCIRIGDREINTVWEPRSPASIKARRSRALRTRPSTGRLSKY